MVRRTFLALVGFSIAVTILVGLKSASTARVLGWTAEAGLASGDSGDSAPEDGEDSGPAEGGSDPSATATPATGGPSSAGSAPASGTPTAPGGGPVPTSASGVSTPATTAASRTYTGVTVAVRTAQSPTIKSGPCGECANYTIAVTITVSSGRITKTSVAYNPSPGGSQSYANSANNKLNSALVNAQAQTWNLGRVSGATYAGNAWELSVKDAMAKAGLPV
jgi:uncharacterized protein with FMN-binding domain